MCTQPRTVAASSMAQRVSDEQASSRWAAAWWATTSCSVLEYITKGVLLRKAMSRDNLDEHKLMIMD